MEEAKGKEDGLELVLLDAGLEGILVEVGVGPPKVGLEVLRGLVGNLDGRLENSLRNLLVGISAGLGSQVDLREVAFERAGEEEAYRGQPGGWARKMDSSKTQMTGLEARRGWGKLALKSLWAPSERASSFLSRMGSHLSMR